MKRRIIAFLLCAAAILTACGCTKKTNDDESKKPAIKVFNEYTDRHVSFKFDFPSITKNELTGAGNGVYDKDCNYLLKTTYNGKSFLLGVSKYFINDQTEYDMLRVKLSDIRDSKDIFDKLSYKINFNISNNSTRYFLDGKKLEFKDIVCEDEIVINEKEDIKASKFSGNASFTEFDAIKVFNKNNGTSDKKLFITGYAVNLKDNPVLIYIISLDETVAEENEIYSKAMDELIKTFTTQETSKENSKPTAAEAGESITPRLKTGA